MVEKKNPYLGMSLAELQRVDMKTGKSDPNDVDKSGLKAKVAEIKAAANDQQPKTKPKFKTLEQIRADSEAKVSAKDGWVAPLKKDVKKELAKSKQTDRAKQVDSGLKDAGLTDSEIERLKGPSPETQKKVSEFKKGFTGKK